MKRKYRRRIIIIIAALVIAGCSHRLPEGSEPDEAAIDHKEDLSNQEDFDDAESIAAVYRDIYEEAAEADTLGSLETLRRMVARLGENGYVAVDSENQVNMAGAEQAVAFYKAVEQKKKGKLSIVVIHDSGFQKSVLKTEDGNVNVSKGYCQYDEDGCLQNTNTVSYPADDWQYTEDGYLFFSGSCFSAENYALTLSDLREYNALRILPLDEKCRELNRKYILPVGYGRNNMFLTNWNKEDFADLDFCDAFDKFYLTLYKQPLPYITDGNSGDGKISQIPENIFENVVMTFIPADREILRSKTTYIPEESAYEYRPRGFYEAEYPDIPYPEVVDYTENQDGTITLIIHAVYPNDNTSMAYSHKTVIRPLSEDCFQYVSNQMISLDKDRDIWWHSDRPTEEEWIETYGEIEKGYDLPISDSERNEAEADCEKMMALISELYENAEKGQASNVVISEETMYQMVEKVKDTGYPIGASVVYFNMENYEELENFLNTSMAGSIGSVIVYEIHLDGGIGRYKYSYDGKDMYVLAANATWNNDHKPIITYISDTRIKEWKFAAKGWFCYELCVPEYPEVTEIMDGSCLVRVKPMTEENREMWEKCVLGLGYQGNNLLCSNWDADHMERLDYNGMYEYLYAMKYQKKFPSEEYPNGIPKDDFESLLTEYLSITPDEIQKYAVFDEENQTYGWERLGCFNYAPTFFGTSVPEVTHIRDNNDGTVTLTVDAVCRMILCDDAVITHGLTVLPLEDGSFKYLGNKILDDGISSIPEYQYRVSRKQL